MTAADVLGQFLSGLARAGVLFLIAAGLSFIFGVVKIVNFAHGALYMVGAFLTYSFTVTLKLPFWWSIVLAAVCVAVIGILLEILLFRRVYGRPVADQLLLTFAMVLIIHDVMRLAYGSNLRSVPRPPLLAGAVGAPLGGIRLGMDFDIIILAFATVIVGGFGSLPGTALAAFIIGEAYAFGIWFVPTIALSLPFIIMAAVLIARPWGLLGRAGGGEL